MQSFGGTTEARGPLWRFCSRSKVCGSRFGGVTALDGADLTVEPGRITGLIGPNGAGKTTLFNAVTGALRPNAGAVTFDGTDVTGWRPDRLAAVGLSRTFQIARGLAQLTVIENLMLYGKHQPGETFCGGGAAHRRGARARGGAAPARDRGRARAQPARTSATIARSISPAARRNCSSSAAP